MEGKKFAQLDSIRFFAIFLALGNHYEYFGDTVVDTLEPGFRAMDSFFVLSGFLITLGLFKSYDKERNPGNSLRKFYIRRFLRIFPVYYLALFLFWCLSPQYVSQ